MLQRFNSNLNKSINYIFYCLSLFIKFNNSINILIVFDINSF